MDRRQLKTSFLIDGVDITNLDLFKEKLWKTGNKCLPLAEIEKRVLHIKQLVDEELVHYKGKLNDRVLRSELASSINYELSEMKANGYIFCYDIVCDEPNNYSPKVIDNHKLTVDVITIKLCAKMPIYKMIIS